MRRRIIVFVVVTLAWGVLPRHVFAHGAVRHARACRFQHAVWTPVVQKTAEAVDRITTFQSTDDVDNAEAPIIETFHRALVRYRYPRGYFALQTALQNTWNDIGAYVQWTLVMQSNPLGDTSYDVGQAVGAQDAAQHEMGVAWSDATALCP
jgi:hypothetical protein